VEKISIIEQLELNLFITG